MSPTVLVFLVLYFLVVLGIGFWALRRGAGGDLESFMLGGRRIGPVVTALTLQSVQGALMVMISHGISTAALFLLVGMLYERRHTRLIADYGGIARVVPFMAATFTLVALSSIGLPGTSGFVGEFLVLLGSWGGQPWFVAVATTGVIFAAVYLLWALQRIFFNPLDNEANEPIPDLSLRERLVMLPLLICILWIGLYPKPILERMEPAAATFTQHATPRTGSQLVSGPARAAER